MGGIVLRVMPALAVMVQDGSSTGRAPVERADGRLGFRVLGRLEVARPTGDVVTVRRAKPATLLAALLIHAGDPVTVDALVDAMWPKAPPATAVKTLQTYVGQVRSLLEPDRKAGDTGDVLRTEGSSYRLAVEVTAIDAGRFAQLTDRGEQLLPDDPASARELFDDALRLWRGPPYADVADRPFARPEIRRLEELRMAALEGRLDAQLALGELSSAVPQLQELARRHPLREHLWAQLMRALYLSGRQADALAAFASARDALVTDLGVDPGPELRRAHRQILAGRLPAPHPETGEQAPTTNAPTAATAAPAATEQRTVTVVAAAGEDLDDHVPHGFAATVQRYGGTVAATGPSTALVVFGARRAREDDTERAVRCAFALRRWARSTGAPLGLGVRSGEAVVDRGEAATPTVRGEPVTGATALAQRATPDRVLVDQRTVRTTGHAMRYEAGTDTGIWHATGVVAGPSGRPLSVTPFVGRETELGVMTGLWDLALRGGRSQLVTVVGPAGIGKSRLVQEFGRRLGDQGVTVLTGRSHPVGDAMFGALQQVIAQLVHLEQAGAPDSRRAHIEEWLTNVLPPEEWGRQPAHLVTLLSILGDIAAVDDDTIESLRRLVEAAAARQPLLVVFDDLHVAHTALVDLVVSLVGRVRGVPLLTVVAARPQLLDAWPALGAGPLPGTTLPLDALPEADARALATAVESDTPGPTQIGPVDAAGGNPLFIEELARWRTGHPTAPGPMPPTVRSVIMSRLDRLATAERRTLIDASVVGSRFWADAVHTLAGDAGDETAAALDALELDGLIVRQPASTVSGQRTYAFRHAVFAEVAYATIPDALRADKHFRLARWLDGVGEDVPPALLAHHWRRARGPERAADELVTAGDAANQGWGRGRAVSCYQQAIEVLEGGDPERVRQLQRKRAVALQAWAHSVLDLERAPSELE